MMIYRNKKILLILFSTILGLLVAGFLIQWFTENNRKIDVAPEEATSLDILTQVNIQGFEDKILESIGSRRKEFLSEDLFVFAKTSYSKYEKGGPIGFLVKSIETDEGIILSGRFGATKNTVTVSISNLNYDRSKISIVDTKTGMNIDSYLPSNSLRNQFIGSLPKNDPAGYYLNYSDSGDMFVGGATTQKGLTLLEELIKKELNISNLTEDSVSIILGGEADTQNIFGGDI